MNQLEIVVEATFGLHLNKYFEILNPIFGRRSLVTRCFGLHSNFQGVNEIRDLPISVDFFTQKHRVVTPTQFYISMIPLEMVQIRLNLTKAKTFSKWSTTNNNHGHILKPRSILGKSEFSTNKAVVDIQYKKHVQLAS